MNSRFYIVFLSIFFLCISTSGAIAADAPYDYKNFKKYNPDVNKYEFVKNYIIALSYLKTIVEREEKAVSMGFNELHDPIHVKILIGNNAKDNLNLRIARNLLKNFKNQENGLILKAIDLFTQACNVKTVINNEEKKYLTNLYNAQTEGQMDTFGAAEFNKNQEDWSNRRKEASKEILEASLLVQKVLISAETNSYGDFEKLAVTENERDNLLDRLNEFYGEGYDDEVRDGQTFLEGSVSAIREILKDYNWQSYDG